MTLLDAMDAGCRDISAEDYQEWIRQAKRLYPRCGDISTEDYQEWIRQAKRLYTRCIARDDIICDVDRID